MDVGIYARISLDQGGEGLGIQRQVKLCRDKAKALGWNVLDTYEDNDVSASRAKPRPEYERLLEDLRSGRIKGVVVWAIDRLTRQPMELETFIGLTDQLNVALANVTGDVDLSTGDGKMYARILGSIARGEADKIGARVKAQAQQRAASGKKGGGKYRVFGYTRQWEVIEEEAAVVREAFQRKANGEASTSIARDFNNRKIRTVAGAQWTASNLAHMYDKTEYAGKVSLRGVVVSEAAFDRIIDEVLFEAVQIKRGTKKKHTNVRQHLLSGILVCSKCYTPMAGGATADRASYRCVSPMTVEGACGSLSIEMRKTDSAVFLALWSHVEANPKPRATPARDYDVEIKAKRADLKTVQDSIRSGQTALEDGLPIMADIRSGINELVREQAERVTEDYGAFQPYIDWQDSNLAQKRVYLQSWLKHIVAYPATKHRTYQKSRLELHFHDGTITRLEDESKDELARWKQYEASIEESAEEDRRAYRERPRESLGRSERHL